jgi:hypothetical protein
MNELHIRHDRAAPVLEIPPGGALQITIVIAAPAADYLVRRARLEGTTPEAIAENIIEARSRKAD